MNSSESLIRSWKIWLEQQAKFKSYLTQISSNKMCLIGIVHTGIGTWKKPKTKQNIFQWHISSFPVENQTNQKLLFAVSFKRWLSHPCLHQHPYFLFYPLGLCGNFNMVLSDDMKTPQGIVEGTAATFCNSWKANLMCKNRDERLDDPCSLSMENGKQQQLLLLFVKSAVTNTNL